MNVRPVDRIEFPEPENTAQAAYYQGMQEWQESDQNPIITTARVDELVLALLHKEGPSKKELGQVALALQFLEAERSAASKVLRTEFGYPWPIEP